MCFSISQDTSNVYAKIIQAQQVFIRRKLQLNYFIRKYETLRKVFCPIHFLYLTACFIKASSLFLIVNFKTKS